MAIDFNWFEQEGFLGVLSLINNFLILMRFIVPIVLILMTTIDIFKKVIDPNDKEGQEKMARRLFAAFIVFLLPTVINLIFDISGLKVSKPEGNSNTSSKKDISDEIVVCPDDQVYHIGDYIFLKANLPSNYSGRMEWKNSYTEQNVFQINLVDNGYSANLKVLNKPNTSYGYIFLYLDNETIMCKIRID